jgi:cyclopropane fatty-acyl-phospholipid synthase-like methyltransferase
VVAPADSVLEIGCEWGTTTELLAQHTPKVIGTDISWVCLDRARELRPELDFRRLDAFDIGAARSDH